MMRWEIISSFVVIVYEKFFFVYMVMFDGFGEKRIFLLQFSWEKIFLISWKIFFFEFWRFVCYEFDWYFVGNMMVVCVCLIMYSGVFKYKIVKIFVKFLG